MGQKPTIGGSADNVLLPLQKRQVTFLCNPIRDSSTLLGCWKVLVSVLLQWPEPEMVEYPEIDRAAALRRLAEFNEWANSLPAEVQQKMFWCPCGNAK